MANLEATSLFSPLANGRRFIQQWTDLDNDNGDQTNMLFRLPGSAFIAANSAAGAWQRSARSVDTVSGVFTIVLRAPFSSYTYMGLNIEGNIPTYPYPRYSRSPYAVTTQTIVTTGQVSRVIELGVPKGSNVSWSATSSVTWAICDTGSAIVYKYSLNGTTWTTHYTSLAAYVPNQVYRVDVGTTFGDQFIMVEVYSSVLV